VRKRPKIVVIGGGTGTYNVLTGLRKYPVDLFAIVPVTDSGGSTGILRDEFGILPPGDARQALLALSNLPLKTATLRQLFGYRFNNGGGLKGHSFGNLFLTALTDLTGRPDLAIKEAGKILNVEGRVYPVSLSSSNLYARLKDGTIIKGEKDIDIRKVRPGVPLAEVYLDPKVPIYQKAKRAIMEADLIVLGPGDLYTSVIPNLLVSGVTRAIAQSKGKLIFVCNLMTKHGETDNFKASDFIREIKKHLGPAGKRLKVVLVNKEFKAPKRVVAWYKKWQAYPVEVDSQECAKLGVKLVKRSFITAGRWLRHDPKKLALEIMKAI
jgi:uncharacterized cofD-like protein